MLTGIERVAFKLAESLHVLVWKTLADNLIYRYAEQGCNVMHL